MAPERAAAMPSIRVPPKKTDREEAIIMCIASSRPTEILFPFFISSSPAFSSFSPAGSAQILRDNSFTFATFSRSVVLVRMRLVWVMVLPSESMAVTMILEVMVNTSARTKPYAMHSLVIVSSTRLTSAPCMASSSPASIIAVIR